MTDEELKKILESHKLWLETKGSGNVQGEQAYLVGADLRCADLRSANLRCANLVGADLRGADLVGADLRGAYIDYSAWPLWCGSLDVKIDSRIAAQLVYHVVRACQSVTDDAEVVEFCNTPVVVRLANRFHRAEECGRIPAAGGQDAH